MLLPSLAAKNIWINKSKLQLALILLAVGIVLAGGYFSLLGFRANHVVEVQAAKLTQQANQAAVSTKSGSTPAPAISTVKTVRCSRN